VIRQAISCDICGAEKRQTNHWFVACEQAGELRIAGWSSRNRLRSGTKHLCGQTCLHKLVDEFMARTIARNIPERSLAQAVAEHSDANSARSEIDASLTSPVAFAASNPPARLPASEAPAPALATARTAAIVSMPERPLAAPLIPIAAPLPPEEPPTYASRRWRAEAWERERNRELRAVDRHPDILRRRKG